MYFGLDLLIEKVKKNNWIEKLGLDKRKTDVFLLKFRHVFKLTLSKHLQAFLNVVDSILFDLKWRILLVLFLWPCFIYWKKVNGNGVILKFVNPTIHNSTRFCRDMGYLIIAFTVHVFKFVKIKSIIFISTIFLFNHLKPVYLPV